MKIVIISAIWCGSCIKMKNVWRELSTKYDLNITKLDIDFDCDEAKKYSVGDTLPVFIVLDNNNLELERLVGEKKIEEIENVIDKYK